MKILVVDDEMDVRMLFEQRFRREIRSGEFTFSFAYSGEEALTFLRDHPSEVVLILSDINMPGMSGLELLRHVKSDPLPPPPPRVMMLTAYGDEATHQQALQLGADDFLTKPVDFATLRDKLHAIENT
ncbi:response regulator [Hymenobacter ginsengisoli]|uniref:Response regulator n=1 Tax=Hymenobacter ginsengisoli TaxID=1051626 RepID=A0ABP8QQD0_9BACT|nr:MULTISPECIES: response regulator [unclassified Hymenobacter]MBO2033016.1 response regulator [Hymenobacter sp. BT559]